MTKRKNYLDIVLLIILSLLVIGVLYWDFSDSLSVSINDFLLLGVVVFAVRLTLYKSVKGQWLLLILILIALPGIFTVNYNISGYSSHTIAYVGSLKFNPLSFLLLLVFLAINRRNIIKVLYGSEEDQDAKAGKAVKFYYDKFNSSTPEELNDIFKMYNEYPPEAQIALK